MTYRALRRKSDKQYGTLYKGFPATFICSSYPVPISDGDSMIYYKNSFKEIDWSLYELVTVHVIAEDELPSARDLHNWIESQYEDYVLDAQDVYSWLKSQILKP